MSWVEIIENGIVRGKDVAARTYYSRKPLNSNPSTVLNSDDVLVMDLNPTSLVWNILLVSPCWERVVIGFVNDDARLSLCRVLAILAVPLAKLIF